jgi:hypothetical protein
MRKYALFINGVYKDVLQDIYDVQKVLPEQILFLQPHSQERIVKLADNPPTVDDQVRVFTSLTNDLPNVHYTGEIVGWYDKDTLSGDELMVMNRLIYMFQRDEPGVYLTLENKPCKNLLLVRRLKELKNPFSVSELKKLSDDEPLSTERTQSGGWSYVEKPDAEWLAQYL